MVVSGETRVGAVYGILSHASTVSGMGAGVGAAANGCSAVGVPGVGGETGYTMANFNEISIRGRGCKGRSE